MKNILIKITSLIMIMFNFSYASNLTPEITHEDHTGCPNMGFIQIKSFFAENDENSIKQNKNIPLQNHNFDKAIFYFKATTKKLTLDLNRLVPKNISCDVDNNLNFKIDNNLVKPILAKKNYNNDGETFILEFDQAQAEKFINAKNIEFSICNNKFEFTPSEIDSFKLFK